MKQQDIEKSLRLRLLVKAAVFREWDPIGVNKMSGPDDEYDAYVPKRSELLLSNCSEAEVFDFLWLLETKQMGMTGNRSATEGFARRLLQIHGEVESESTD